MVIKLLMNSMQGKTIIKPVETYTLLRIIEMILKSIFHTIIITLAQYVMETNDKFYIKKAKSILSHFKYAHCGVEFLKMSNRITTKVLSCADDCDIEIYYKILVLYI